MDINASTCEAINRQEKETIVITVIEHSSMQIFKLANFSQKFQLSTELVNCNNFTVEHFLIATVDMEILANFYVIKLFQPASVSN